MMDKKSKEKEIVELLEKNEVAMRDMYLEFKERYGLYEVFWQNIAEEEESHAAWVNTLYYKMDTGLVDFSERKFPVEAIEENIRNMQETKEKAQRGELTLLDALERSVHMEHGMLENKFFEAFKTDSLELQIVLEALRLGTLNHYHEVEKIWKKEKYGDVSDRAEA